MTRPDFRVWIGTERLVFITRGAQFYLSMRALGLRLRLHSVKPYATLTTTKR